MSLTQPLTPSAGTTALTLLSCLSSILPLFLIIVPHTLSIVTSSPINSTSTIGSISTEFYSIRSFMILTAVWLTTIFEALLGGNLPSRMRTSQDVMGKEYFPERRLSLIESTKESRTSKGRQEMWCITLNGFCCSYSLVSSSGSGMSSSPLGLDTSSWMLYGLMGFLKLLPKITASTSVLTGSGSSSLAVLLTGLVLTSFLLINSFQKISNSCVLSKPITTSLLCQNLSF